jgi:hypothetical protein
VNALWLSGKLNRRLGVFVARKSAMNRGGQEIAMVTLQERINFRTANSGV